MTGLHYPDNLYADEILRAANKLAVQQPTGAYRAAPEMPESERKLRTALAYVNHARDLIRDALGDNEPNAQREAKIAYDVATCSSLRDASALYVEAHQSARPPKWHTDWPDTPPIRDNLKARDIRAPHPMNAETLRQADEFGRDDNASGV